MGKYGCGGNCNHGFASYVGHVLYRDVLGVKQVDYVGKEINIRFSDIDLDECNAVIPVDEGSVEVKWKRINNQIRYSVKVPPDYKVKVENASSSKLMRLEL
jgi:alpha-L-rhamnosidase